MDLAKETDKACSGQCRLHTQLLPRFLSSRLDESRMAVRGQDQGGGQGRQAEADHQGTLCLDAFVTLVVLEGMGCFLVS